MPLKNPVLRQVHRAACAVPPLINTYRKIRDGCKTDPLVIALYQKIFDRGRLHLPVIAPEKLAPESGSIQLPMFYPLLAGEDTPLRDLIFLLNLAKGRQAKRILEVGTFRARTTYALHLNCPEASIVSYDIQVLDSPYRRALLNAPNVQLRHASFAGSVAALRREPPFDLIFVDGSHRLEDAIADSKLALERLNENGVVVWHDYRRNDYCTKELRVPEALDVVRQSVPIFAVSDTTCAVHVKEGREAFQNS
jgi:predicted O-methyltransferase YrrM